MSIPPHAGKGGRLLTCVIWLALLLPGAGAKEYLTEKEIEKIQDAREIDKRIQVYMEAADLRLRTVEDRLNGKESVEGDPMEFFSLEDMMEGYYRILRSVMFNIDDAFQSPSTDRGKLEKALKKMKDGTRKAVKDLEILKKVAEENKDEQTWTLVHKALDITRGAFEGAELGLARFSSKPKN